MNKVLIILIGIVSILSTTANAAINYVDEDGQYVISEVVTTENMSKADLYQNALIWISETFNSPKTVIQTKDSELGLITLNSRIITSNDYYGRPSQWYTFNLKIQVKDGRYKYEFSNVVYNFDLSDIGKFIQRPLNDENIESTEKDFQPIIQKLKKQMIKSEDW